MKTMLWNRSETEPSERERERGGGRGKGGGMKKNEMEKSVTTWL